MDGIRYQYELLSTVVPVPPLSPHHFSACPPALVTISHPIWVSGEIRKFPPLLFR